MTVQEAEEVMNLKNKWEDESCSCHITAPCSKCESMPPPECIEEAEKVLNE